MESSTGSLPRADLAVEPVEVAEVFGGDLDPPGLVGLVPEGVEIGPGLREHGPAHQLMGEEPALGVGDLHGLVVGLEQLVVGEEGLEGNPLDPVGEPLLEPGEATVILGADRPRRLGPQVSP